MLSNIERLEVLLTHSEELLESNKEKVNAFNKENEELEKYNLNYNSVSLELVALKKQREKKVNYILMRKEKTYEAKNSIERELQNRIECKDL